MAHHCTRWHMLHLGAHVQAQLGTLRFSADFRTLARVATPRLADLHAAHVQQLGEGYARVLADNGYDAAVVHSGTPHKRSEFDDQYWPLRVTPHFQHWLPLAEPECALVVAPGRRPKLIWSRPVSFWEKP